MGFHGPDHHKWMVIFCKQADAWGAFSYDPDGR